MEFKFKIIKGGNFLVCLIFASLFLLFLAGSNKQIQSAGTTFCGIGERDISILFFGNFGDDVTDVTKCDDGGGWLVGWWVGWWW